MAIVSSAGLTIRYLLLGSQATKVFGVSWLVMVPIYFVALLLGGLVFGALLPLKRHPAGAMLLGFLFMLPVYVVGTVLLGGVTLVTGLWIGVAIAAFAGSIFGLLIWGAEEEKRKGVQDPDI